MKTITPITNTTSVAEADVHLTLELHDFDHLQISDLEYGASQKEVSANRFLSQTPTPIH